MEDLRPLNVKWVSWEHGKEALLAVRYAVFVDEQGVPIEIEQDEDDPKCEHLLVSTDEETPIGTARLSGSGKVGRVAVLKQHRKQGIGRLLMEAIASKAKEARLNTLVLHAQEDSMAFYESLGYQALGGRFLEAGIPHFKMQRKLP